VPKSRKSLGRRIAKLLPSLRTRRRVLRLFRRAPRLAQALTLLALALVLWLTVNWLYQVVRKPSELFFPVSGTLNKTPAETWRQYAPLFRKYSTSVISPELLAALAQVEGSGNPVVRTYWRWSFSSKPFEVYRPASRARTVSWAMRRALPRSMVDIVVTELGTADLRGLTDAERAAALGRVFGD